MCWREAAALTVGLVVASATLPATARAASVTVTPATVAPGSVVTIAGSGFAASERGTVRVGPTLGLKIAADRRGRWRRTLRMPARARTGARAVVVRVGAHLVRSVVTLAQRPRPLRTIAALSSGERVALSRNRGTVGVRIRLRGWGFAPGARVGVRFGSRPLKRARVDSAGRFSALARVPPARPGRRFVIVRAGLARLALAFTVSARPTVPAPTPAPPPPPPPPPPPSTGGPANGQFNVACKFTHRNNDDPIVFPGLPGAAHSHDFVGNSSVNAFSTQASLAAGATNCHRPLDKAGYWMPTVSKGGVQYAPFESLIYYRGGGLPRPIRTWPAGLKMIAGNPSATSPQSATVVQWQCEAAGSDTQVVPHQCAAGVPLSVKVKFPNCWNGTSLDSPDHRSHVVYGSGSCPTSHPVGIPQLQAIFAYPVSGSDLTFSAGNSPYTAHADFFDAWNLPELQRLVDVCINANKDCGLSDNGPAL